MPDSPRALRERVRHSLAATRSAARADGWLLAGTPPRAPCLRKAGLGKQLFVGEMVEHLVEQTA
jgi:hypothetical protein